MSVVLPVPYVPAAQTCAEGHTEPAGQKEPVGHATWSMDAVVADGQ